MQGKTFDFLKILFNKKNLFFQKKYPKSPISQIIFRLLRQLKAFHISKRTKQVNVIVVSRGVILLSAAI